jgi:hypothetical protein
MRTLYLLPLALSLACAPAQRVEVFAGGTHTMVELGREDAACLERRLRDACVADHGSAECKHPRLLSECYEQRVTMCSSDIIVTTIDYDHDGELEPSEERSEAVDYDCLSFDLPASTR